jgi:hypothetical protein
VIESWLKAIRDHPDRPPATEQVVLERLALRLDWVTGKGFCSVQQLMEDTPAGKRTVLRALAWAQSEPVAILEQTRRGGRRGAGYTLASEWALAVPESQGAADGTLRLVPKVPDEAPQGASSAPPSRPVLHQDLKEGDDSLVPRRARPSVRRIDAIRFVRLAAAEVYGQDEADYLTDSQCAALWYHLIGRKRPGNPVKYLSKPFRDAPYLDTHVANAGDEEDWEAEMTGVLAA